MKTQHTRHTYLDDSIDERDQENEQSQRVVGFHFDDEADSSVRKSQEKNSSKLIKLSLVHGSSQSDEATTKRILDDSITSMKDNRSNELQTSTILTSNSGVQL